MSNPITNSVFLYPQMAPLRYAHVIFAFLAANYIMVRKSYMNKNLILYKEVHENNAWSTNMVILNNSSCRPYLTSH